MLKRTLLFGALCYGAEAIHAQSDAQKPAVGCLIAYGPIVEVLHHHVATFVDRILRGSRASDLPVEMPMKFDLTINLATARALGVNIDKSLLLRAQLIR